MENSKRPEVTIVSRIFAPESAAASFRLEAVAKALIRAGSNVRVLTASLPSTALEDESERLPGGVADGIDVSRWWVLRDKTGYVRGYLPYLSFDIPLFFRLLFGNKADVVLVEPPPTTGVVSRIATAVRRTPYVWYAADVWSDATEIAGAPRPVVAVVRMMEKFALRGASGTIAVSEGVAERVKAFGARNVRVIPNGIDTETYRPEIPALSQNELLDLGITGSYLLYAGTASEWQGARIFADAMDEIASTTDDLQVVFVGSGSEWQDIEEISKRLTHKFGREVVVLLPPRSPERVARLMAGAEAALVSIVPGMGYDFAYPTKVLAGLSVGVPVLYVGRGPVATDVNRKKLGVVSNYELGEVQEAMASVVDLGKELGDRRRRHSWVEASRSLRVSASRAARFVLENASKRKRPS